MPVIDTIITLTKLSVTGSADDIASIDVPEDGFIVGLLMSIIDATLASGENVVSEVSFLSTSQNTSNDARGLIGMLSMGVGVVTTSGNGQAAQSLFLNFGDGIPVNAGERIHLHTDITGAPSAGLRNALYFSTKGGGRRSAKRR